MKLTKTDNLQQNLKCSYLEPLAEEDKVISLLASLPDKLFTSKNFYGTFFFAIFQEL